MVSECRVLGLGVLELRANAIQDVGLDALSYLWAFGLTLS